MNSDTKANRETNVFYVHYPVSIFKPVAMSFACVFDLGFSTMFCNHACH